MNKTQLAEALNNTIDLLDSIWRDEQFDTLIPEILDRNALVYASMRAGEILEATLQSLASEAEGE